MPNGTGRSADFNDGSERVREPQFYSKQQVGGAYRATSVLDSVLPPANGLANLDNQRRLYGFNESALGRSETTFDKELFIRDRKTPMPLYKNFG